MDKLIISTNNDEKNSAVIVRISKKASALLDDIVKRSARGKSFVANKMIEFAYEHVVIEDEEDE